VTVHETSTLTTAKKTAEDEPTLVVWASSPVILTFKSKNLLNSIEVRFAYQWLEDLDANYIFRCPLDLRPISLPPPSPCSEGLQ
jgi:hypothetical protein